MGASYSKFVGENETPAAFFPNNTSNLVDQAGWDAIRKSKGFSTTESRAAKEATKPGSNTNTNLSNPSPWNPDAWVNKKSTLGAASLLSNN